MWLIAGLSLIALSPVSLEDYSQYKQEQGSDYAQQSSGDSERVAGVFDESDKQAFQIDNLLANKKVSYEFSQLGDEVKLTANFAFDSEAAQKPETQLLKFTNNTSADKLFNLSFDYTGEGQVVANLYGGSNLQEVGSNSGSYTLVVPGLQSVELKLVRDTDSSFESYELKKPFSLRLQTALLEQELVTEDSSGNLIEVLP